jgi:hypothetical protein
MSGAVNTVMAFNGLSSNKLLAANGTKIYDISAGGAVGAAVQSGLTSDKWQYITFSNSSGNYLYMVNGSDAPRYWDGTTWTNAAITGPSDITKLIHINANHNRVWFCESGTLTAWYLGVNSIAGAATAFYLTGVARKGGYLMAMATWTIDEGYGINDMAVFLTSKGEVIVYQGTDPSSASTWSLLGVFEVGSPVGRRCFMKYKGDLCVITQDGLVPLAQGLQSSRLDPRINLTDKIQFATSTAITNYGNNFGWQVLQYPQNNMILLNVPVAADSQEQYVMNTISGSWCRFTGWGAYCWELYNEQIYFGGNGYVGLAWNGLSDNGSNITTDGLQAFNYFGSPGVLKRYTMMRPILYSDGSPAIAVNVNTNFDTTDTTALISFQNVSYATWDSAKWDSAMWGGGLQVSQLWQGVNGVGYCGAPRVKSNAQGIQIQWVATDIVSEKGAIL